MPSILPWHRKRTQLTVTGQITPSEAAAQALKLWRQDRLEGWLDPAVMTNKDREQASVDAFYAEPANRSGLVKKVLGLVGKISAGDSATVAEAIAPVEAALGRVVARVSELQLEGETAELPATRPRLLESLIAKPTADSVLRILLTELSLAVETARAQLPAANKLTPSLVSYSSQLDDNYISAVAELSVFAKGSDASAEFKSKEDLMLLYRSTQPLPGANTAALVDAYSYFRDQRRLMARAALPRELTGEPLPAVFDFVDRTPAEDSGLLATNSDWTQRHKAAFGFAVTAGLLGAFGAVFVLPVETVLNLVEQARGGWAAELGVASVLLGLGAETSASFAIGNRSDKKLVKLQAQVAAKQALCERFSKDLERLVETTSHNMARQCQADESLAAIGQDDMSLTASERFAASRAQARLRKWGSVSEAKSFEAYGRLALAEEDARSGQFLPDSELANTQEIQELRDEAIGRVRISARPTEETAIKLDKTTLPPPDGFAR